jgi:hypothetical protein
MSDEKPNENRKSDEERNEEFENFQRVLEKVLSVPKEELDRRRAEYERKKREREKKQAG